MSEKLLNDFREYLENKKKFSMNTINSYDRDLRKIFLYLVEMGYSIEEQFQQYIFLLNIFIIQG